MIKRISILGLEKTGKTRLSQDLSTYFSTNFVIDYNNLIYKSLGKTPKLKDYKQIISSRKSIEDWLTKISKDFIFLDTCDLHTIWEISTKYPKSNLPLRLIKELNKSDLYIITKIDKELLNLIKKLNINYLIVEDDNYSNMRQKSITELEKIKNEKF
jgi:nicotinamide riboside kinase